MGGVIGDLVGGGMGRGVGRSDWICIYEMGRGR